MSPRHEAAQPQSNSAAGKYPPNVSFNGLN